jgi:hypothetical protein
MAKGKLPPFYTLNTLESMIEYTLISSILDKICEMTTKPWEYPRDDTWLLPPPTLVGNWNMGNIMEESN